MRNTLLFLFLLAVIIIGCNSSADQSFNKEEIIIFHAGSLSVPFKEIADSFQTDYPDYKVILEASGSVAAARKITDLHRECDIMASADYTIIEKLLIPGHTGWLIQFARNEMVIAFRENAPSANNINADNWYKILSEADIRYGRSNPDTDPCGYRTVQTLQLAENYYENKNISQKLLSKDQNYIRPKETDLLSLLETATIDYIFIYRSVAQQHQLNYIPLPKEINLSAPGLAADYAKASVKIAGKKPGTTMELQGKPMVYGITLLDNAPNQKAALKFLDYLLDDEKGSKIMQKNGQESIAPKETNYYNLIPESLKKYMKPKTN